MKTRSKEKMPTYQVSGKDLNVFWNEQEIEDGYEYDYCVTNPSFNYPALVVDIIRSKYTINDEFSAVNDGGEKHQEFLNFRIVAKNLAKEWIEKRNSEVLENENKG